MSQLEPFRLREARVCWSTSVALPLAPLEAGMEVALVTEEGAAAELQMCELAA